MSSTDYATAIDEARRRIEATVERVNCAAEYAELGGESRAEVYKDAINLLQDLAMVVRDVCSELQTLRDHQHQWNANDFCTLCGADGRA